MVGAEGVDVFVLSEVQDLREGLAEIGEVGGGFELDMTLGDGGEKASEGRAEIAGRDIGAGEEASDLFANVSGGESPGFFAGVERTEVGMARLARHAAAVAVAESEGTFILS